MKSKVARRTDFLASCQALQQSNPILEEIREKGAEVVLSLFRLTKNSLVHALGNETILKTVEQTVKIISNFGATVGGAVSVTYIDQTIFVCGQLMRASRAIYESGMELGRLLERCGVSEITVTSDATAQDLLAFAEAFSISARDPKQRGKLLQAKINNITVRKVETSLLSLESENADLPEMEKMLMSYAASLVVLRDFFDRIAAGKPVMLYRLKRIAQRMVTMAEEGEGALLALTTLANAHRDDAGRAIQAAILTTLVARRITSNRQALGQLALSALVTDVGRVRIAGPGGRDQLIQLTEEAEKNVPPVTSAIGISTGGVNIQSAMRTVTLYETTFTERENLLGPLYGRAMSPMVQTKILMVVRALLDYLAPRDTSRSLSPLNALAAVSQLPNIDKVTYKLLVSALGVMPTGTVVEFETGEWGIVIGPSANKNAVGQARIKLITDRSGQVYAKPKEIDLGESDKKRYPKIVGIIEPDRARFNITGLLASSGGATAAG